jgi:Tfp pilus assembly protein PilF
MRLSIILFAISASVGLASDNDYTPPAKPAGEVSKASSTAELFKKGQSAVALGNFAEAEKSFSSALKEEPKNADILNMLAYSQRKQGKTDRAFSNYYKALAIRPNFPQAREYLGEAHIQAALKEIETLKSYGAAGKEDLEKLTAALKEAAESIR